MKKLFYLLLLCGFMAACSNEKATKAEDETATTGQDSVVTPGMSDEQAVDIVKAATDSCGINDPFRKVTNLGNCTIITFTEENKDEILRIIAGGTDTIITNGDAAMAVIIRHEPLSVDTLRITREDLNDVIHVSNITELVINSIDFKEARADTLVFDVSLVTPDTDWGDMYDFHCYYYDGTRRFERYEIEHEYEEDY